MGGLEHGNDMLTLLRGVWDGKGGGLPLWRVRPPCPCAGTQSMSGRLPSWHMAGLQHNVQHPWVTLVESACCLFNDISQPDTIGKLTPANYDKHRLYCRQNCKAYTYMFYFFS